MNQEQQELYEKLLKKVNEYCLGYAAEDVIAAIDALVENYEVISKRLESVDRVGEMFCVDVDKKLKALEIFKRNCLLSQYPDGSYELAFPNKIQPRDEDVEILKEVLK